MHPDDILDPLKSQIVAALTMNISASPTSEEEMKNVEYAAKGLFHAIPYAHQNFKVT
jgi:hypothetical protein